MRRLQLTLLSLIIITLSVFASGCNDKQTTTPQEEQKIKVYTSIYPLYDFASKVGGDKIEVINIIPPGGEPHEWEPSPRDLADISQADILIYCGSGIESWAEKILPSIDRSKVTVIDASEKIDLIDLKQEEANHGHHNESTDPHIWLDPINAKSMVDNILVGLCEANPNNTVYYQDRALNFKKQLDSLHNEYQTALASAKGKEFIVSHAAFGYLSNRYGIKQVPIRGLSPEVEPSPSDMAHIVKIARDKGIKYIFTETMVSTKVSEALANEVAAQVLVLNPMGGLTQEEIAAGHDYLFIMKENLKNLKLALGVSI